MPHIIRKEKRISLFPKDLHKDNKNNWEDFWNKYCGANILINDFIWVNVNFQIRLGVKTIEMDLLNWSCYFKRKQFVTIVIFPMCAPVKSICQVPLLNAMTASEGVFVPRCNTDGDHLIKSM